MKWPDRIEPPTQPAVLYRRQPLFVVSPWQAGGCLLFVEFHLVGYDSADLDLAASGGNPLYHHLENA